MALEMLWEIFDRPCGQRLKPLVEGELGRLRALGELRVDEKTARQLQRVSPATIDRLLTAKKTEWIAQRRYGRVGGNLIAKKIPLKMTDWDLGQVGFLEMDLVLHCGASTAGEYAHSLSALEIGSAWWEGEAMMGRAQSRIFEAIKKIRSRTPFLRESGQLPPEALKKLDDLYHSLNPADLKRRIDQKLKNLYTLYEKKRKGPVQIPRRYSQDPSAAES